MAINDVVAIVVSWTYSGNLIQNQFVYKYNGSACNAVTLGSNFLTTMIPDFQNLLTDGQDLGQIYVANQNNPADFSYVVIGSAITGNSTAEALPSRNAIQFYSPTKNRDIRQGRKQVGVTTAEFQDGSLLLMGGAQVAFYDALVSQLGANVSASATGQTASPINIKRNKSTSPSGKPVYTLPAVATSTNHYVADNWEYNPIISTQATRKLGRGA